MTILDQILSSDIFVVNPPILLDIGASGSIHSKWQPIARHSIGIGFDADERDIDYAVKEASGFKKLYMFNRLVVDGLSEERDFCLTRSPHCSSLLVPDHENLARYNFGDLFEVEHVVRMKTVQLKKALDEIGVKKVDWFKTDSQGTDLRLFASLGEELMRQTLIAEFEPGIIDGYKGEDKLYHLMAFMDMQPFWMNDIKICGTQRLSLESIRKRFPGYNGKPVDALPFRTSPCWAEVSYFNNFGTDAYYLELRDYLLGWIFALIEGQYGFALDIALQGQERFNEPVFEQLVQNATDLVSR